VTCLITILATKLLSTLAKVKASRLMFLCENKVLELLLSAASFETRFQFWRIAMQLNYQRHVKITKFVASVQEGFRDS
jgi:hypothetical protein